MGRRLYHNPGPRGRATREMGVPILGPVPDPGLHADARPAPRPPSLASCPIFVAIPVLTPCAPIPHPRASLSLPGARVRTGRGMGAPRPGREVTGNRGQGGGQPGRRQRATWEGAAGNLGGGSGQPGKGHRATWEGAAGSLGRASGQPGRAPSSNHGRGVDQPGRALAGNLGLVADHPRAGCPSPSGWLPLNLGEGAPQPGRPIRHAGRPAPPPLAVTFLTLCPGSPRAGRGRTMGSQRTVARSRRRRRPFV
jgi:hypothetical protein